MRLPYPLLGSLAALLLLASTTAAGPRGASVLRSTGDLGPTTARPATGAFELVERVTRRGHERARVRISAAGLDATPDERGRRVEHGAFLVLPGGDDVFLGQVRVRGKGAGHLRRRDLARLLDAEGTNLRSLSGGAIEVRGPAGTVLSGSIPGFDLEGDATRLDRRSTYGLFVPVSSAAPNNAPGRFTFRTDAHTPGDTRNRLLVQAPSLPPTSTYTVYLFGPRTVNLGNMENQPNRGATLSLDSRRAPIPGGIGSWSEFDGGTIEVRRGGTIMLRGAISIFRPASERATDVGWARSRVTVPLDATAAGGAARGRLTATVRSTPRRRAEEVRVGVFDLDPGGAPFTVATVEPDGVRHVLGTFRVTGAANAGGFRLSTRRGDRTPPGGVLGQSGLPVEVADASGTVVMTATFPTLD